jgi:hypothetical protein
MKSGENKKQMTYHIYEHVPSCSTGWCSAKDINVSSRLVPMILVIVVWCLICL